jgi:hypothetical protein
MVATTKRASKRKSRTLSSKSSLALPRPEVQTISSNESKAPLSRLLSAMALVAAVLYFAYVFVSSGFHPLANSSGGAAPTHPDWGKAITMQVISKFDQPNEVRAIRADRSGNVFLLTPAGIRRFTNGKLSASLVLTLAAGDGSMDFDGKNFYVTTRANTVSVIPANLSGVTRVFKIKDAKDLLGIAVSPNGHFYVSDLEQHSVSEVTPNGKATEVGGRTPEAGSFNRVVDLALDSSGDLYTHDHLSVAVGRFAPSGKLIKSWQAPWTLAQAERLCVLNDKIYISGYTDQRIFVQDLNGSALGNCDTLSDGSKLDHMTISGPGLDGCLYIMNGTRIFKLKAWDNAAGVSPSASTK